MDEITCKRKEYIRYTIIKVLSRYFSFSPSFCISVRIIKILKEDYEKKKKGVEIGYFREDVSIDLYIKFLITLFFQRMFSPLLQERQIRKVFL